MKKFVFGLMLIGFASLGYSQENVNDVETVELEAITLSANSKYLTAVNDVNTPDVVKDLQVRAASFDPRSAKDFDSKSKRPYEAIFKATNGKIYAAYGPRGQILSSQAKFSNVTLPMAVRKQVFEGNEGWIMRGNQFLSTYVNNEQIQKKYRIHMQNGERSRKLIVDLR